MKRIILFVFLSLFLCSCSKRVPPPQTYYDPSTSTLDEELPCPETESLISADFIFRHDTKIKVLDSEEAKVFYPHFDNEELDKTIQKEITDYLTTKKPSENFETYDFFITSREGSNSLIFYDTTSVSSSLLHRFSITFTGDWSKTLTLLDFFTPTNTIEHIKETVNTIYVNSGAFRDDELPDFFVKEDGIVVIDSLRNEFFIPDKYFFSRPPHKVSVGDSYTPVIDRKEKVIALTFDDGPNYFTTLKLLQILKEKGAHATFFTVGYNIPGNEFIIRRMLDQGCDVGIHSYSHRNYYELTTDEVIEDIHKCADLIKNAADYDPYLVRAPYGNAPDEVVKKQEYFFINWCVDPYDWHDNKTPEEIAEHIFKYTHSGDIVLLHDLYEHSIEATEIVLDKYIKDGWRFVTISELFDLKDKTPTADIYYGLGR